MVVLFLAGFLCAVYCVNVITDKKLRYTSVYQILAPIVVFVFAIVMFILDYNSTIPEGSYMLSTEVTNTDKDQSYYYDVKINVIHDDGLYYSVDSIVRPNGRIDSIKNCDYVEVGDSVRFIMPEDQDNNFPDFYKLKVDKEDIPVSAMTKLKAFSFKEAVLIIACLVVSVWAEYKVLQTKAIEEYEYKKEFQ